MLGTVVGVSGHDGRGSYGGAEKGDQSGLSCVSYEVCLGAGGKGKAVLSSVKRTHRW